MFLFIVLMLGALLSAIPLNVLLRLLGDERAQQEGGKSIMAMYLCYGLVFAFWQFLARPQQMVIGIVPAFAGWFLVIFAVVFPISAWGRKRR